MYLGLFYNVVPTEVVIMMGLRLNNLALPPQMDLL
jgi:hypothetical protein